MTDPVREAIIDNVASTLAAVTVANGYRTNVASVSRIWRSFGDIHPEMCPTVEFYPLDRSRYEDDGCGVTSTRLQFVCVGWVTGADYEARDLAVSQLEDDLHKALLSTQTRGGNAVRTQLLESEFVGLEDYEPISGVLVSFEVWYQREVTQS